MVPNKSSWKFEEWGVCGIGEESGVLFRHDENSHSTLEVDS